MAADDSTAVSSDNEFLEQGRKLKELLGNVEEGAKPPQDSTNAMSVILRDSSVFKPLISRGGEGEEGKALWNEVKKELESLVTEKNLSDILLHDFDREMDVLKDARHHENKPFKTFTVKDTTLNNILRLLPPKHIEDYIAENIPTYAASRKLYNIVKHTRLSDHYWKMFHEECSSLRKGHDGCELNRQVFTIRHGGHEDTILARTVCMNPPLSAVALLLKECRETLSFLDCPKNGWIPLQNAIKYQASPEVVSALIPTEEDIKQYSTFQKHDFLNEPDNRDRTVLHWAAYYRAQLDTIKALRKACSKEVLKIQDHCEHLPYETAIWHGSSADIIEAFFEPGLDGHSNLDSVFAKLIRSLTDVTLEKSKRSACEEEEEKDLENQKTHYSKMKYDLCSIAARIVKSNRLQKEVEDRLVKTLPTFIKTADIGMCALVIVSYYHCADDFIQTNTKSDWIIPLTVAAVYITIREIADLYANKIRWFFSIWNYFDVATISLLIYSLFRMWFVEQNAGRNGKFENLAVVTTVFIWANAMSLLRSTFKSLGKFVTGILGIGRDLMPFLVVSFFILLLFGVIFRLGSLNSGICQQFPHNTTEFCTFEDSLSTTYGLFLSGIDIEDYVNNPIMRVLSIAFGLIVGIILLNVVIAIVSDAWNEAIKEAEELFWLSRMEFLMLFNLPTEESSLDKVLQWMDDLLGDICKPFWPGKDYVGLFDSFFDRMLSDDVGSFRWQVSYECGTRSEKKLSTIFITLKAAFVLALFCILACIWIVIGLFSIGTLWPRRIRCFILGLEGDNKAPNKKEKTEAVARVSAVKDNEISNTIRDQAPTDILLTVTRLSNDIDMLLKQIKRAESEVTLLVPSTMVLDSGIEN